MANDKEKLSRRIFIKTSSIGLLGAGLLRHKSASSQEKIEVELPKIQEYRMLGRTGFKVSDISCGGIYIQYEAVLKALLDKGLNYIHTAPAYSNGLSESTIGKCLKDTNRKSLFITTSCSLGKMEINKEKILLSLRKSLERLKTDYVDCLMIRNAQSSDMVRNKEFHAAVDQLKNEGRVRFCGIACHGEAWMDVPKENMEQILMTAIHDGRFDILLLVYNFLNYEVGRRIMEGCKEKNIGTTIMKSDPISWYYRGKEMLDNMTKEGREIPESLNKVFEKYKKNYERADSFRKKYSLSNDQEVRDAAIKFILNNRDVNSVLISFKTFDDIDNYIRLSGKSLTSSDKKSLKDYEETFGIFYCRHACGECESQCPYHVPINKIMRYNHYFVAQNSEKYAMEKYKGMIGQKANVCNSCEGFCESACPHGVPIQTLLTNADKNLTFV